MLKKIFLFALLFVLITCKKDPSLLNTVNLNGNKIGVIGHGGMGLSYRYPMNSKESLLKSIRLGTSGTEMDVCVTKDSVMVLCHSQSLEDNTNCVGLIKEMNWSEIKNCNFKTPIFSDKAHIIDASTFFDAVENKQNLLFVFDCKIENTDSYEYLNLFAESLLKHIKKYELTTNGFIESFNISFLKLLETKNNELHLFMNTQDLETGLEVQRKINLFGLVMDTKNITEAEIKEAHKNNLRVALFNTKTQSENLNALLKSPDYIQTDKVEYLVNIVNSN